MDIVIAFLVSLVAGVVLWAVVPRGVVLTRSPRNPEPWDGHAETEPDTWWLTNSSAVPAKITEMTLQGIGETKDVNEHVRFMDHALEARREGVQTWDGVVVPPGETFKAHVPVNHDLVVRYRRDGWTGFLEHRKVAVHGYA